MISIRVKGKTLEVVKGSHIYFGSEEGIGFIRQWDELETQEIKDSFAKLAKMAEKVMDMLAAAAVQPEKTDSEGITIN